MVLSDVGESFSCFSCTFLPMDSGIWWEMVDLLMMQLLRLLSMPLFVEVYFAGRPNEEFPKRTVKSKSTWYNHVFHESHCCSWYARNISASAAHMKSVVVQWFGQGLEYITRHICVPFSSFFLSISVRIFVWLSDGFLPCCSRWRPSHVFATVFALLNVLVWHVSWAFAIVHVIASFWYIHCGSLYIYWLIVQMSYILPWIWLYTIFGIYIRTTFCWPIFFRSRWSNLLFAVKDIAATASGTNMKKRRN